MEMKIMKKIILLLVLLTTTLASQGAPIPTDIKKVVVFIYYLDIQTNVSADGTGFLVGVPAVDDTNKTFVYLVTARHVLRPSTNNWLPGVFVRLNRKDGTSDQIPVPLVTSGPNKNVFVHDDSTVDIAVVPFAPQPFTNYDSLFLPIEFVTSEADFKSLDIHEGSDVFFTGMFTHHLGDKRNTPITRFGKVALMTDEKIDWVFGKTDLYLMEANSYPGNSGSPVFFQVGSERANGSIVLGGSVIKLAGVMSGYVYEKQFIQTVSVSTNQFVAPNLGIAGVVPSYELREILFSKELKQQRGGH
jgi:hypothetical protein